MPVVLDYTHSDEVNLLVNMSDKLLNRTSKSVKKNWYNRVGCNAFLDADKPKNPRIAKNWKKLGIDESLNNFQAHQLQNNLFFDKIREYLKNTSVLRGADRCVVHWDEKRVFLIRMGHMFCEKYDPEVSDEAKGIRDGYHINSVKLAGQIKRALNIYDGFEVGIVLK